MNYITIEKELLAVVFALKYLITKNDAKLRPIRYVCCCSKSFELEIKDKKEVENVVADHLSWLIFEEKREVMPIKDDFPNEQLLTTLILQWFAHMVNYLVLGKVPQDWDTQDRRRLFFFRGEEFMLGWSLSFHVLSQLNT